MAANTSRPSPFYHHARYDCYECLGCNEMLEVPYMAVLRMGSQPVPVKSNPENRLVWLELLEIKHGKCGQYSDAEQLKQHMEFGLRGAMGKARHETAGKRAAPAA